MKNIVIITVILAVFIFATPFVHSLLTPGAAETDPLPRTEGNPADESSLTLLQGDNQITTIGMADYLIGCVFAQMPANYHPEALKAQALAAHTYAKRLMLNNKANPEAAPSFTTSDGIVVTADLSDDPSAGLPYFSEEQARDFYGEDYDEFYPQVKAAADYAVNRTIMYNNEPIYAVFTALSNGTTNTALDVWGKNFPYLQSVPSDWDKEYRNYERSNEMTVQRVRLALMDSDLTLNLPVDYAMWFSDVKKNTAGYVQSVSAGDAVLSGGDMWRLLSLVSADFNVTFDGSAFRFVTHGAGHGVGMSQYGANYLANNGMNAESIIYYYYTDVDIKVG
jgi:stage II sporulation protein D